MPCYRVESISLYSIDQMEVPLRGLLLINRYYVETDSRVDASPITITIFISYLVSKVIYPTYPHKLHIRHLLTSIQYQQYSHNLSQAKGTLTKGQKLPSVTKERSLWRVIIMSCRDMQQSYVIGNTVINGVTIAVSSILHRDRVRNVSVHPQNST